MSRLALVNAPVIEPVFRNLPIPVTRVERMCENSGLPGNLHEDLSGLIALSATERFLVSVQQAVGDPTFLFRTLGWSSRAGQGNVANIPLPRGATGIEAVAGFAATADRVLSGARILCRVSAGTVWLLRTTASTDWTDNWPVYQYNLSVLMTGIRQLFDPPPGPVALLLPERPRAGDLPEMLRDLPVTGERGVIGIGFALRDIALAGVRTGDPAAARSYRLSDMDDTASAQDVAASLAKFIGSTAQGQLATRVARSFGMSPRTYRRHLERLGTCHSELVSTARLDRALAMLDDPAITVTQIAFELGYDYPGDFSRFFSARVGLSPTRYRQLRRV